MPAVPRDLEGLKQALTDALGITSSEPDEQLVQAYRLTLCLGWERMEAIVGPLGARAIMGHAVKVASRRQPLVALVSVHDDGPDLSALEAHALQEGYQEVCDDLKELCAAMLQTLLELTGEVLAAPLLQELRNHRGVG